MAVKKKRGRPTEYDPDYHPAKAEEFCAEYGLIDIKLARLFDVDKAQITRWKKEHPEFRASVRRGKDEFDSKRAEKSLNKRINGYLYTETTKELTASGMVVTKQVRKHVPPAESSLQFFLRNRQRERWPDRQKLDVEGEMTVNVIDSFNSGGKPAGDEK